MYMYMHSHARARAPARRPPSRPLARSLARRSCVCVVARVRVCVLRYHGPLRFNTDKIVWKHVCGRRLNFFLSVPISVPEERCTAFRRPAVHVSDTLFLLTFRFRFSFRARRADFFYCSTNITTLTSSFWWTIFFQGY